MAGTVIPITGSIRDLLICMHGVDPTKCEGIEKELAKFSPLSRMDIQAIHRSYLKSPKGNVNRRADSDSNGNTSQMTSVERALPDRLAITTSTLEDLSQPESNSDSQPHASTSKEPSTSGHSQPHATTSEEPSMAAPSDSAKTKDDVKPRVCVDLTVSDTEAETISNEAGSRDEEESPCNRKLAPSEKKPAKSKKSRVEIPLQPQTATNMVSIFILIAMRTTSAENRLLTC